MTTENRKKLKKRWIALIVCAAFIGVLLFTFFGFYIGFWMTDGAAHVWTPDYEMLPEEELKAIYYKDNLTENDYRILFEQTGLTEIGIERAKERGADGWERVKKIQEEYFYEGRNVDRQLYAPLVCNDRTDRSAVEIYLERGDIIVSSSTHFAGFRIGHTAVVTDPRFGEIFEATQVGQQSHHNDIDTITNRINFMILRVKPEDFGGGDGTYTDNLDRVTRYIEKDLKDATYSVFTGVFTNKNKIDYTMCSHLVWYAFKYCAELTGDINYALDLDSNGGLLVMPKDISRSPHLELVQTFGFNPDKMYE